MKNPEIYITDNRDEWRQKNEQFQASVEQTWSRLITLLGEMRAQEREIKTNMAKS